MSILFIVLLWMINTKFHILKLKVTAQLQNNLLQYFTDCTKLQIFLSYRVYAFLKIITTIQRFK